MSLLLTRNPARHARTKPDRIFRPELLEDRVLLSGSVTLADLATNGTLYKKFTDNRSIPDGPSGAWVGWNFDPGSAVPSGARVTSVTVHHKIVHKRIGDLESKLYNDAGNVWILRDNEGGTTRNLDQTKTDSTVFAGTSANQVWHYRVRDTVKKETGYLDTLEIWVNYTVPAGSVTLIDTSVSTTTVRDGQTILLNYQLSNSTDQAIATTLDATLVSPSGKILTDSRRSSVVNVTPGTNWYSRSFWINVPPAEPVGAYDVTWTVTPQPGSSSSITRTDLLAMQPPISVRVPVLMYHELAVGEEDGVAPAMFRAHLQALQAYGYTTITLQELMDIRAGLTEAPAKPVLITLDDGYTSLYTDALPILTELNDKATAFIFTEGVSYSDLIVTWEQLQEIHQSGRIEIEGHTISHAHLKTLGDQQLRTELVDSKKLLETRLGKEIRYLSYPYGEYDARVQNAAWDAGYAAGTKAWGGVESTSADKWALARISMLSTTSVDYDPGNPQEFLFNKIQDTSVVVPQLSVSSMEFLDPVSGLPLPGNTVLTGQAVRVRVTATNSGPAAVVRATLQLDSDTDRQNGVVYNSHALSPDQDIQVPFETGQTISFEWTWVVPVDAAVGQYQANVKFFDVHHVLGFHDAGWRPAFVVANPPVV